MSKRNKKTKFIILISFLLIFFTLNINAALPVLHESSITPILAYTNNTLTGYCNASDADGDNVSYEWKWYKNNEQFSVNNISIQEEENIFSSGDVTFPEDVSNVHDSNFNNYGYYNESNTTQAFWTRDYIENYTIPDNIVNAIITIKYQTLDETSNLDAFINLKCEGEFTSTHLFKNIGNGDINGSIRTLDATVQRECLYYNQDFDGDLGSYVNIQFSMYSSNGAEVRIYESYIQWIYGEVNHTQNQSILLSNFSNFLTSKNEEYIFSCRASDGLNYSSWINSSTLTISNSLPIVNSIILSPTVAYTNNTLIGNVNITDEDSDNFTVNYKWYINGVENTTGYYNNYSYLQESATTSSCSGTFQSGYDNCSHIDDGDYDSLVIGGSGQVTNLYFNITTPYDAIEGGSVYYKVKAGSFNETLPNSCFNSTQLKFKADLSFSGTSYTTMNCYNSSNEWELIRNHTGLSQEAWFYEFAFYFNKANFTTSDNINVSTLDSSLFSKNDNITLSVRGKDNEGVFSGWSNSSILTISNIAPTIDYCNIANSSNDFYTNNNINANISGSDLDDDSLNYYYEWLINGYSYSDDTELGGFIENYTAQGDFGYGLTNNNIYMWNVDYMAGFIYKYYMNGTYIESSSLNGTVEFGITNNNTFIWTTDYSEGKVRKYYMNGTYTEESFLTSAQMSNPFGLVYDSNGYLWILDGSNKIYKYYINGTYTGSSININRESGDTGSFYAIDKIRDYLYIIGETDYIYKYKTNGTKVIVISNTQGNRYGLTHNNTHYFMSSVSSDKISKYQLNLISFNSTFNSLYISKEDEINLKCQIDDGEDNSSSLTSSGVTILNSAPSNPIIISNFGNNVLNHELNLSFNQGTDLDGDTIYSQIYLSTNPSNLIDYDNTTNNWSVLSSIQSLNNSLTYYVVISNYDGEEYSSSNDSLNFNMAGNATIEGYYSDEMGGNSSFQFNISVGSDEQPTTILSTIWDPSIGYLVSSKNLSNYSYTTFSSSKILDNESTYKLVSSEKLGNGNQVIIYLDGTTNINYKVLNVYQEIEEEGTLFTASSLITMNTARLDNGYIVITLINNDANDYIDNYIYDSEMNYVSNFTIERSQWRADVASFGNKIAITTRNKADELEMFIYEYNGTLDCQNITGYGSSIGYSFVETIDNNIFIPWVGLGNGSYMIFNSDCSVNKSETLLTSNTMTNPTNLWKYFSMTKDSEGIMFIYDTTGAMYGSKIYPNGTFIVQDKNMGLDSSGVFESVNIDNSTFATVFEDAGASSYGRIMLYNSTMDKYVVSNDISTERAWWGSIQLMNDNTLSYVYSLSNSYNQLTSHKIYSEGRNQDGSIWNSQQFKINETGTYNYTITYFGNSESGSLSAITDEYTISPNPFSVNIRNDGVHNLFTELSHDGNADNNFTFTINILNESDWNISYINYTSTNSYHNQTITFTPDGITSGSFNGSIEIYRTFDNKLLENISFNISVSTFNGIISLLDNSDYSNGVYSDESFSKQYVINNTGDYNLTSCSATLDGDYDGWGFYSFSFTNTTMQINQSETLTISFVNVPVKSPSNTWTGDLQIFCVGTPEGYTVHMDSDYQPEFNIISTERSTTTTPGGGSSSSEPGLTIEDILNLTLPPSCGNGICSDDETPYNCWQDCHVNYDTLVTCIWDEDVECNWSQNWFIVFLVLSLMGIAGYIYYQKEVLNKGGKNKRR